jgi:hypothetical protein
VSRHKVWRILRAEGICLARQRSWCVSTDPQFARKATDIIGLYLHAPLNALVLSVDEKPVDPSPDPALWLRQNQRRQGRARDQKHVQAQRHRQPLRHPGCGQPYFVAGSKVISRAICSL